MNAKAKKSFDELKALWVTPGDGAVCSNPECPNMHRIHILAETITINNLIVSGELPADLKQAIVSRMAA